MTCLIKGLAQWFTVMPSHRLSRQDDEIEYKINTVSSNNHCHAELDSASFGTEMTDTFRLKREYIFVGTWQKILSQAQDDMSNKRTNYYCLLSC